MPPICWYNRWYGDRLTVDDRPADSATVGTGWTMDHRLDDGSSSIRRSKPVNSAAQSFCSDPL